MSPSNWPKEAQVFDEGKLIDQGTIYTNSFTFSRSGLIDAIVEFNIQDEQVTTRFIIDVIAPTSLLMVIIGIIVVLVIIGIVLFYRSKRVKS